MKQILDLRPVYHRLEQRIRVHVVLCWLTLLLIRIIETSTGQTWHHVRRDLDRLHAVTFTGPTGTFRQRTDPTKPQIDLYARLDLPLPKKVIEITPTGRCPGTTLPPSNTRAARAIPHSRRSTPQSAYQTLTQLRERRSTGASIWSGRGRVLTAVKAGPGRRVQVGGGE